jgi:predicted dehydrogenase
MLGAGHRPGSGGGFIIGNAYHSIYTAEVLLGAPVMSVQAQTGTYSHDYDVEDTAMVIMQHASVERPQFSGCGTVLACAAAAKKDCSRLG